MMIFALLGPLKDHEKEAEVSRLYSVRSPLVIQYHGMSRKPGKLTAGRCAFSG